MLYAEDIEQHNTFDRDFKGMILAGAELVTCKFDPKWLPRLP